MTYTFDARKYSTHSIILNLIGKEKVILDVGCGRGYIGKNSDRSNMFYGLDISKEYVRAASAYYVDCIEYDLNILQPLPWNIKFDLILFADVLEHTLFPDKVLSFFVKNYLKNGGKVIVSLPNIANWKIRLNLLFGRFQYTEKGILDKTHLHFYTFKTAKELCIKSDLKIKKVFGGASILGPLINIFPFLKSILATNIIIYCSYKK